jgi:beta-phosphoglucomutase-like phosphatase (HAD superfamily)
VYATLLDFDGVLVDSEPVHLAAFNETLAPHGIVISEREYLARYFSLDDAGVFRAVLSHAGRTVREDEVRALVADKSPRFLARFADSFRVFPGAVELVERRARRGIVGIVSGALEQEIAFALDRMGVSQHVQFIVSAERAPASKPDPAPYRVAMEELHKLAHVEGTVVVEDSVGGVLSAKNAGLRCVAVAHTYRRDELLRVGADAVVADLAALTEDLLEG